MNSDAQAVEATPLRKVTAALQLGHRIILPGFAISVIVLGAQIAIARWYPEADLRLIYLNLIIPGSLFLGIATGMGYWFSSWLTGTRPTAAMLWIVAALQFVAYASSEYESYTQIDPRFEDGTPVGFVEYFDVSTRSFAWQKSDGSYGEPFGVWGYAMCALNLGGYVFGGVGPLLWLRRRPYCEECQMYMRIKPIGFLPAGATQPRLPKLGSARAEFKAQDEQALSQACQTVDAVLKSFNEGNVPAAMAPLTATRDKTGCKAVRALTRHIRFDRVACPACHQGAIQAVLCEQNNKATKELAATSIPEAAAQALHAALKRS